MEQQRDAGMGSTREAFRVNRRPASLLQRAILVAFCLAAGLTYRASVSLIPAGIWESAFLLGLAALLLALSLLARRRQSLSRYWQVAFAFFIFTVAGLFGDGSASPVQHWFVRDVLHETTTSNNPLASSVSGMVLAQLFATLLLVVPIVALTRAANGRLSSIFISRPVNWWGPAVAVVAFLIIYYLVARGRTESFFPTNGAISVTRLLALTPALLVLVLLNGLREELWFRGLFLDKYGQFLSPLSSNLLAALIFTSFHVEVRYSASIVIFLMYALVNGLILGWLMQRSRSVIPSLIFHAGTDIPIFLVYLSYASG